MKTEVLIGQWIWFEGIYYKVDSILSDDKVRLYSPLGFRGLFKEVAIKNLLQGQ